MFSSEKSYPGFGDPRYQRRHIFSVTDMLGGIFDLFPLSASETGIISN